MRLYFFLCCRYCLLVLWAWLTTHVVCTYKLYIICSCYSYFPHSLQAPACAPRSVPWVLANIWLYVHCSVSSFSNHSTVSKHIHKEVEHLVNKETKFALDYITTTSCAPIAYIQSSLNPQIDGCVWIWRYKASHQHLQVIGRPCVFFLQHFIYAGSAHTPGSHKKCLKMSFVYGFRIFFCLFLQSFTTFFFHSAFFMSAHLQLFFHCLSYLIFYEVTFSVVALFGLWT